MTEDHNDPPTGEPEDLDAEERRQAERRTGSDRRDSSDRAELEDLVQEIVAASGSADIPEADSEPLTSTPLEEVPQFEPEDIPIVHHTKLTRKLPHTDDELREIVTEIVGEILERREVMRRTGGVGEAIPGPWSYLEQIGITRRRVAAAAVGLVMLVTLPIAWLLRPKNVEIPTGMVGLWITPEPRYADRGFRVTTNTLTIHIGNQDSTFHTIDRVRRTEESNGTLYTIFYDHVGEELQMGLLYNEQPDTIIQLFHQQDMIWKKYSPADSAADPDSTSLSADPL